MRGALRKALATQVRPTARGWQALLVGLLVLVVGFFIGTTQFYQLAYTLLALTAVALGLGLSSSRALALYRKVPAGTRITAGESSTLGLLLTNESRLRSSPVRLTDRIPERRSIEVQPVGGGGEYLTELPVEFRRRGLYELGPAEVRSTDPFELLSFTRETGGRAELLVYPKTHELRGFPLRGGGTEAGLRGSRSRRGDEFSGIREYRRGDDRRHIHWKSVARTGELVVKEFAPDAPLRYSVVLDLRSVRGIGFAASESEVEDAVSAAGSVLGYLSGERLDFRLVLGDREGGATEFGGGDAGFWEAMDLLAVARPDGREPLEEVLRERGEELGEGAVLVCRDSALGEVGGLAGALSELCSRGLSVVVVLVASHTYREQSEARTRESEASCIEKAQRLERAGAAVRVVRRATGAAGLGEEPVRGAS
ncbi:MAG: DUF58 domain-containing protein [Rubrobacter sp.]|nr:DUF58 domain-containing protein [Rubrobacter sp.]